jgi:RecG-like helicase
MSRPQPGFAAVDPPEGGWTPTRGRFRPERLEASLETLPGVGPTLRKRLAKLGLERVGDLLDHRPRRYEEPAPERPIADLWGEDEVVIAGQVLRTSSRRGRGRLQILTAQVADASGQITATWFNQPWLQEKLAPGTRVRLRGTTNRYGFQVRSYDLTRPPPTTRRCTPRARRSRAPSCESSPRRRCRGRATGPIRCLRR